MEREKQMFRMDGWHPVNKWKSKTGSDTKSAPNDRRIQNKATRLGALSVNTNKGLLMELEK